MSTKHTKRGRKRPGRSNAPKSPTIHVGQTIQGTTQDVKRVAYKRRLNSVFLNEFIPGSVPTQVFYFDSHTLSQFSGFADLESTFKYVRVKRMKVWLLAVDVVNSIYHGSIASAYVPDTTTMTPSTQDLISRPNCKFTPLATLLHSPVLIADFRPVFELAAGAVHNGITGQGNWLETKSAAALPLHGWGLIYTSTQAFTVGSLPKGQFLVQLEADFSVGI